MRFKNLLIIFVTSLLFIFLLHFVLANERQPYLLDPVAPEKGNIKVNGDLKVDLFTGAATYSYPIDTPPGTNGLMPEIGLSYSNQNIGKPGIVGSAWTFSDNYIERTANFSVNSTDDDEFKLILGGSSYDLVNSSDGRFHTKIENFLFIKMYGGAPNAKGQYWVVRDKDGTGYRFGYYNYSETVANQQDYVWRWSLDLINDTYNNSVYYNYTENPFPNDVGTVYLDKISYNNDKQRQITFNYEGSDRPDLWDIYDDGNRLKQTRRLNEINVSANGSLVKRYVLNYSTVEEVRSLSFISDILEYGENNNNTLPPTHFEYNPVDNRWANGSTTNVNWAYPNCATGGEEQARFCSVANWVYADHNTYEDWGVRYADINGDGLVDIVKAIADIVDVNDGHSEVYLNQGNGTWSNESNRWKYPECYTNTSTGDSTMGFCFVENNLEFGFKDRGVRLIDINGDGLADLVKAKAIHTGGDVQIWLNNGTGWVNQTNWTWPLCQTGNTSNCFIDESYTDWGIRFGDLNGDRFTDFISARSLDGQVGFSTTWINMGNGSWSDKIYNKSWPGCGESPNNNTFCFSSWMNGSDKGTRLVDVNGDGLSDLVWSRSDGPDYGPETNGSAEVWINTGNGSWSNSTGWKYPGCYDGPGNTQYLCLVNGSYGDNGVRLADLNGDNLVDIIMARGKASFQGYNQVWLNNGSGWVNFTGAWNGTVNWTYPQCYDNGTVSSIQNCFVDNAVREWGMNLVDGDGDGIVDVLRTRGNTVDSGDAEVWLKNANSTSFYSIENITTPLGGNILVDYQKSSVLNNSGGDDIPDLGFNLWLVANITYDNGISGAAHTVSNYHYTYAGGKYNATEREFRGFNYVEENVSDKVTRHWFNQDIAEKGREYRTEFLNTTNGTYKVLQKDWNSTVNDTYYVVQLLSESELSYDGKTGTPKSSNATYRYDGFNNLIYKHSVGDTSNSGDDKYEYYAYATNTNAWIVDKIKNYSLVASDNSTKLRGTLYSYDGLSFGSSPTKGDITKKEDLLGTGSANSFYAYDNLGNKVNETDSLGRFTNYSYGIRDKTFTFVDLKNDSKGLKTNYYYDLANGNLLSEKDANNFAKNYTYDQFSIEKTTILPFDNVTSPTQDYSYDFESNPEGKIIVKQKEQNGTGNTIDTYRFYDGFGKLIQTKTETDNSSRQIAVDYYYDNLSRLTKQSNPYFVTQSTTYSTPNSTVNYTLYTYDRLDRVINITNPDGTSKNVTYNKWNVTFVDEKNNKRDYQLDAYGNIILVIENNAGSQYKTRYAYDAANQLLGVKDALNNTLNYTYDSLGRKTKEIDPDRGTWNYSYDSVGNLVAQLDNRNTAVNINYDSLNRKTGETSSGESVNYTYDIKTNNTLFSVQASNLTVNYTYDSRLRKVQEIKIIDGISFGINYTYDSADRVISEILPSGEIINSSYSKGGALAAISGLFNTTYSENNNPLAIIYNNTLVTNYTYDSQSLRLKRIKTDTKQDISYSYDKAGNVLAMNDTSNTRNISMLYDSLNRLVFVRFNGSVSTTLNFSYNPIGNMLNVTGTQGVEFYYNGTLAHVPYKVAYY